MTGGPDQTPASKLWKPGSIEDRGIFPCHIAWQQLWQAYKQLELQLRTYLANNILYSWSCLRKDHLCRAFSTPGTSCIWFHLILLIPLQDKKLVLIPQREDWASDRQQSRLPKVTLVLHWRSFGLIPVTFHSLSPIHQCQPSAVCVYAVCVYAVTMGRKYSW